MMLTISGLFIYPIKSLGGISLSSVNVTDRGFQYDRRWMLVDEQYKFISQRQYPEMALLQTTITITGLTVTNRENGDSIPIPFYPEPPVEAVNVTVWEDECMAIRVSAEADKWFSRQLNRKCSLVYMPDHSLRKVDPDYASHNEITSFADAFPVLMISQASLDDLNNKLPSPIPMNRFRPNLVISGSHPYEEDEWAHFTIGPIEFKGVKLCARCMIPTIDQDTAQTGKEPTRTLATYRMKNNKIYFGQNLIYEGTGVLAIGDRLHVKTKKPAAFALQGE